MKVEWWIGIDGDYQEGELEVDDNASEKDIDRMVFEEIGQLIDWGWRKDNA